MVENLILGKKHVVFFQIFLKNFLVFIRLHLYRVLAGGI